MLLPQYGPNPNIRAVAGRMGSSLPNYYYGQLQVVRELKDALG
jgi:hypothetical protein